ncbi:hypothetical protein Marpi_1616 [Marinitoga piezophila KA3]|uniref:Uncharacterized protein n=1 Tax=Marinitoga piezophila (strain DSM 14283 / JCM 11233 / KA3) TaxID=443254 RepID=H2J4Y8_MARPK|nr:hypothetical protein [Marinitoga sp. 1135]AEX86005.1 hypothetical protein Marpi_1616 [Marinitoga piezophila KA3]
MKKIITLFVILLLMSANIVFAGDNDDEYKTDSINPQIQIEFSE